MAVAQTDLAILAAGLAEPSSWVANVGSPRQQGIQRRFRSGPPARSALVGEIAALWVRGLNLNLSAGVGFLALFGIAVLNGVVMVSHINALRKEGKDTDEAVHQGAMDRLRPARITALVASLGSIPMALLTSGGAEIEVLATVFIGGIIRATALTLYILPML